MNVTNETTRLFTISELTEQQAQDLLNIAAVHEDKFSESEEETLNNLRQALLSAGVKKG